MKVLGINGSPRIGGNTSILLSRVLESAKAKGAKIEQVVLNSLKFVPCQECANTRDDGKCTIEDDMQALYKKIDDADVVVLASPIFFGSLSAQTKMMIDRFQCAWHAKYILNKDILSKNKSGYFICVEASNRKDFLLNAKSIVKNFFATVGVKYKADIFCSGVDEKGAILKHPKALKKAYELGQKIVTNK